MNTYFRAINFLEKEMKKIYLSLLTLIFSLSRMYCFSQEDTIYFHNTTTVIGKIIKMDTYTISYKYKGEDEEQVAGKYAINKIIHQSGRIEIITEKVIVKGREDWQKVVVLNDKSQIAGLVQGVQIRANTKFINLHTANTGELKAEINLLKQAAELKCPFIFITYERATLYNGIIKGLGALQEIKKALVYNY